MRDVEEQGTGGGAVTQDEDESDESDGPHTDDDDVPPQYEEVEKFVLFKPKAGCTYLHFLGPDASDGDEDNIHYFNVFETKKVRMKAAKRETKRLQTVFYPCFYDVSDHDDNELAPRLRVYSCAHKHNNNNRQHQGHQNISHRRDSACA